MGCRRRALVIPFPQGESPRGREPLHSGPGVLLQFPDLSADAPRNAAWDDLLANVQQAWTWRDPDSLTALAVCLLRVARDVMPEWAAPETKA
jgi:hypothetical protein